MTTGRINQVASSDDADAPGAPSRGAGERRAIVLRFVLSVAIGRRGHCAPLSRTERSASEGPDEAFGHGRVRIAPPRRWTRASASESAPQPARAPGEAFRA